MKHFLATIVICHGENRIPVPYMVKAETADDAQATAFYEHFNGSRMSLLATGIVKCADGMSAELGGVKELTDHADVLCLERHTGIYHAIPDGLAWYQEQIAPLLAA